MNIWSYWSFDDRLRYNFIGFYDIYNNLRCLWVTSRGWKSFQWLYSWMLGFCIIHMIGVDCYSKVYLYIYVNDYLFLWIHIVIYFSIIEIVYVLLLEKLVYLVLRVCYERTWFLISMRDATQTPPLWTYKSSRFAFRG